MLKNLFTDTATNKRSKEWPSSAVIGHVDSYTNGTIIGWVLNKTDPNKNCNVVVYHNSKILVRATANIHRPDVSEAGYSTGQCGFSITIPNFLNNQTSELSIVEESTKTELKGSPITLRATTRQEYIFDLSDLVFYLAHHDNPSGIQRVVISIVSSVVFESESEDIKIGFTYFDNESLSFRSIPMSGFLQLMSDLRSPIGERALPIGRGSTESLINALGASSRGIGSNSHTTIVMLGAAWVFPEYFTAVRNHKQQGGKFCCLIHDLIPIKMPSMCDKGTAEIFKFFIRRVCHFSDAIFSVSEYTANDLRDFISKNDLPKREITVLQNGDGFSDDSSNSDVIDYSLPQGRYVLYVSTIEGRKNHQLLVDVWSALQAEFADVPQLVFVGRVGWRVESLIEQIHGSNMLGGKLRIMSSVSDAQLLQLYKNCLFTVYPSLYEGWGLPVSESLSLGKVCVASNRTSIPEVARGSALLFDPNDFDALYEIIKDLCMNEKRLKVEETKLSETFRSITWADVTQRLVNGLNKVAEAAPQSIFEVKLNTEYTFRSLAYLDSNVAHGDEVARHIRSFSSPMLTDRPIGIDNYIYSDLLMGGAGWYGRESWGRWSKFNTDNRLLFRISGDKNVIVYIKITFVAKQLPMNIVARVNTGASKMFYCGKNTVLLAVPAKGPVIDIELNINGEPIKLEGDTRMLGIGYQSIMIVEQSDFEERLNILEVSGLH